MTFLSCYETVLLSLKEVSLLSEPFLQTLRVLSKDPIVDVRIRTARSLGVIISEYHE